MTEVPLTASYREAEVKQIFRRVKAGDSCMIVAPSGMGKSNLFRHLLRPEIREHFLGSSWQQYLFASIDAHELQAPLESHLYELMLRKLVEEARGRKLLSRELARQVQTNQNKLEELLPGDQVAAAQRAFLAGVELLATQTDLHFVILLDQYDEVYRKLSSYCLSTLRHLRDNLKYRVLYLVFTREELTRLGDQQGHEEFNELLSPGTLWLGPYQAEDAWTLLRRIAARYGAEINKQFGDRLIELAGGHPGLLKAAYLAVADGRVKLEGDQVAHLLLDLDTSSECAKLWKSISPEEQAVLAQVVLDAIGPQPDQAAIELLRRKHLVVEAERAKFKVFSPLWAAFVARQQPASAEKLDQGPTEIRGKAESLLHIEAGSAWLGDRELELTPHEFRLIEFLCQHPGTVCARDDILLYVYPRESADPNIGLDDNRVDTLVSRLRARIKDAGGDPQLIATVRGRGFRLQVGKWGNSASILRG